MEPASKRRRIVQKGTVIGDEDDELFLEPEELNQRRDPAFQLQKGRALAANKLKSRFEDIFAKYERDFTDVADEIDLRTGEVVVNNGHLESMEFARDSDDGGDDNDDDENGHAPAEEKRILQGTGDARNSAVAAPATERRDPWQVIEPSWPPSAMGDTPRLSSIMFPDQQPFMSPFASTPPFGMSTPRSLDPAWQAPELPLPSGHHNSNGLGQKTWSTTRKLVGKFLAPVESTEPEEEDILLGVSANVRKTKESPIIKERFPVISSPQEDPSLSEFIQEVIQENMPEFSPSNRIEKTARPKGRRSLSKKESSGLITPAPEKKRVQRWQKGSKSSKVRKSASQGRKSNLMNNMTSSSLTPGEEQLLEDYHVPMEIDEAEPFEIVESHKSRPSNQVLYVEIRTAGKRNDLHPVRDEADVAGPADVKSPEAASSKPNVQCNVERNVVDLSFNFSDDDTLLPRKTRRRRRTEPIPAAAAVITNNGWSDAKSKLGGQPLERNAVDPALAFSDEENIPPRRSRRRPRLSEPAPTLGTVTTTGSNATTDTSHRVDTGRSGSRTESKNSARIYSRELDPPLANSASVTRQFKKQADNHVGAQEKIPVENHAESSPDPPKHPVSPSAAKQYQQEQPATPHRSGPEKAALPTDTSIISLLSDNEDEEDEISFGLTDFTPSGHHRILVHRPFPGFATNPSFSSSKTNPTTNSRNKKKRRSVFSSSHKPKETPPTDDKTSSHKESSSTTKKRRKSNHHNHLARSVVKVRYRHDRLPSPTGSIVQTPGGTKRKCGEGDFRCERDFCFVCM